MPAAAQEQTAQAPEQETQAPAAAAAPAQEAGAPDTAATGNEIVVTARRRAERLQDVPVAASVVSEAQIRQYDLTSVANIRLAAPEITLDRGFTGSATSISLRGVSSSAIDAGVEQSVLLDFDGMAISRGRILNDALFDIESLTVLKGPQAVFFGKNSPGGVVSVRSAAPGNRLNGYIRTGYEFTTDNKQVEAAIGGPIGDGAGARLAIFWSDSEGYIRNQNKGVPDLVFGANTGNTILPPAQSRLGAEKKIALRGTVTYEAGAFDASFKLLASRYEGQGLQSFSEVMGCPPSRTRPGTVGGLIDPTGDCKLDDRSSQGWAAPVILANWPQVMRNNGGRPYSRNDSFLPVLTLNYDAGSIALTSVTGYYGYDYVSQGNADATSYAYFWSYSNEQNSSFYQELRATSSFDGPLNFAAGGHYENNRRTLYVGGINGSQPRDPATGRYHTYDNEQHNKSEAWSAFGQLVFDITPQLELAGGARYTRQTNTLNSFTTYLNRAVTTISPVGRKITGTKTQDNISPEATMTWRPTNGLTIYGAYKTGFLAGGYSNPGILSAITTIDTLSFEEETVDGAEIGIKTSLFDNRFNASLTGYRYVYKGLPLTSLIAINATTITYVTQNAANTEVKGLEFEASWRGPAGITLRATAAYNDARFKSFERAQCWTGQTLAQGCLVDPVTRGSYQNLTGRRVYRAPKWIATAGAVKTFDLGDAYEATFNADVRYSSSYFTGVNLNPYSYQKGYLLLNAGAKLTTGDGWSLALIGRNLTNRRYGTLGIDKPGGVGEVFTVAGEPRAVVLQAEMKF
ncbi:MAG: TonB-dependent receptor [Sphingomonas sp.]|uniref:TonB-dependent receptor n=1 Tax=Sphingomonas sp. TaxID=28214 RepID=UPI002274EBE2|nr:TonB-dependent receptor [Sphingomonas sp.]MCX8474644.1 TonB-dependent receptor [Sphingomonas sp.]